VGITFKIFITCEFGSFKSNIIIFVVVYIIVHMHETFYYVISPEIHQIIWCDVYEVEVVIEYFVFSWKMKNVVELK
jgi:hypothetical protein